MHAGGRAAADDHHRPPLHGGAGLFSGRAEAPVRRDPRRERHSRTAVGHHTAHRPHGLHRRAVVPDKTGRLCRGARHRLPPLVAAPCDLHRRSAARHRLRQQHAGGQDYRAVARTGAVLDLRFDRDADLDHRVRAPLRRPRAGRPDSGGAARRAEQPRRRRRGGRGRHYDARRAGHAAAALPHGRHLHRIHGAVRLRTRHDAAFVGHRPKGADDQVQGHDALSARAVRHTGEHSGREQLHHRGLHGQSGHRPDRAAHRQRAPRRSFRKGDKGHVPLESARRPGGGFRTRGVHCEKTDAPDEPETN